MTDDRELSALMRDGMAAQAREISASSAFTEQLIRTSTQTDKRAGRGWQNWILPLAAAVFVALLVSTALIGGKLLHASRHQPNVPLGPQPTSSAPNTPNPSPTATGSNGPSSAPPSTAPAGPVGPSGGAVPAGFRAVDLTWVSLDQGWALGTAPCGTPPCTSIVRTTDGGQHWTGIPAPVAGLAEASDCTGNQACITGLRFANSVVGYAYGSNALFLTTDGGSSWQRLSGGAYGLEIANGTVLRLISSCLPGCPYRMQRATIGTDSWTTVSTLAGAQTSGAQLVRSGHLAVLLTEGHVAGGGQHATSVLFSSTDDGASWTSRGEPCPQGSTEVDSIAVTIAPDNSITVLCALRGGTGNHFTTTSTDGGAHFTAAPMVLGAASGNVLGAASSSILLVNLDQLYRSPDGGSTWRKVDQLPAGPGGPAEANYIGFESDTVGRVLALDADLSFGATSMWTTTDAGRSWTAHSFG